MRRLNMLKVPVPVPAPVCNNRFEHILMPYLFYFIITKNA